MDERNASQNPINLNIVWGSYWNVVQCRIEPRSNVIPTIGQLLNLLDNVNKNYVRKLEKLNKNFVNNKCGISFNKIYTFIYMHIYVIYIRFNK